MSAANDLLANQRERLRNSIKWRSYPDDVLAAWVADMDFPAAEPIRAALADAAQRSDLGYVYDPRDSGLADVAAKRMADRHGWHIAPQRIEFAADVIQAIFIAVTQFSRPGDEIALLTPSYPPLLECIHDLGRKLLEIPLRETPDGFRIDVEVLPTDARPKILLFNNPHNPTGRAFDAAELRGLAEWALKTGCTILSDEIHQDLVYAPAKHVPFAMLDPELAARTITFTSATKAFNVAGVGCAAVVFGSEESQKQFNGMSHRFRGHVPTLSALVLRTAWEHPECQRWLDETLGRLRANRDSLFDFIRARGAPLKTYLPQATYLAWCDCRALATPGTAMSFFLKNGRVAFAKGEDFGERGRGFVRINFATTPEMLAETCRRLAEALAKA